MRSITVVLGGMAIAAAVSAPAQQRKTVAAVGDQMIRVGRDTLSRPFGAELMDRLVVVGSYTVGGKRTYLIRGDRSGPCPSRFVFATERTGAAPIVSASFGTCSGAAVVRSSGKLLTVSMPTLTPGQAPAQFAFDGSSIAPLTATAAADPAAQCPAAAHVDPTLQAATIAAFESDYPTEYRTRRALDRETIDPQELRSVVTTLACFAPWPAGDRVVPELALPLFRSRHAEDAFAALTAVAEDPASSAHVRAAARSFTAEMIYQVGKRRAS